MTERDGIETIDTKLYPFRPTEDSWYTSQMVKRTESFGYSYPETVGLKYPTSPADKTAVMKTIGEIYEPLSELIRESKKHIKTAGEDLLPQAHILKQLTEKEIPATAEELSILAEQLPKPQSLLKDSLEPSKPLLRDLAPENKYLEWITNVKAEKHTLDGEFSVHVFLGPPGESNVALWPVSPNHVGTFVPLGQPSTTGCGKCHDDQRDHTQVTGQIPLTIALVERYLAGLIPNLTEETVVPYLNKHLHWRVAKVKLPCLGKSNFLSLIRYRVMVLSLRIDAMLTVLLSLLFPTRLPFQRMMESFPFTLKMSKSILGLPLISTEVVGDKGLG